MVDEFDSDRDMRLIDRVICFKFVKEWILRKNIEPQWIILPLKSFFLWMVGINEFKNIIGILSVGFYPLSHPDLCWEYLQMEGLY